MKRTHWILLIIIGIVTVAGIYFTKKGDFDSSTIDKDKYIETAQKTIENKQLISGRIHSNKEVNIKSELAGIIDELYVNVGDQVKKGQAIAKIKTLPDPKSTQDADRQLQISTINLEKIRANYNRVKLLYEKEVIPRQEFEIANQEYKSAEAEMRSAQNYLRIVKQGFSSKSDFVSNVIYSTIDGIVLEVPAKIGSTIQNRNTFNEGTNIAVIADMTEFVFKGQVTEKDLRYIDIGKELLININALKSEDFHGQISKMAPKGVDVSGITRFDIEAKLDLKPAELYKIKPGFTASAEFLIEKVSNALSLEEKYIQYAEDTAFVYVYKGKEKKKTVVQTGISDGKYIEIKSGLKKGDRVSKETGEEEL